MSKNEMKEGLWKISDRGGQSRRHDNHIRGKTEGSKRSKGNYFDEKNKQLPSMQLSFRPPGKCPGTVF